MTIMLQVIFTKGDGTTIIEQWVKGEKVETDDVTNADAITRWDNISMANDENGHVLVV